MIGRDSALEHLAPGDFVYTPDVVLSPDGPKKGWSVAVAMGAFVAAGPTANVLQARPDLPEVALPGTALTPGFVDSHQHLTQVFAKALIGAQPAQIWKRMWLPLYTAMSPEDAYTAAKW
ncbi:MAG: amidohydrolase, partial [Acidimicrobiia bacterium]